nr:alpha-amylase family glycosyl hydrolase [Tessaracoccus coleopterorum]
MAGSRASGPWSTSRGVPRHLQGCGHARPYLKALGITTIELLPVHETNASESGRDTKTNAWGYMTLGFFAPNRRYAHDRSWGGPTREFKEMVSAFHDVGLEVYLDVVYNHTAEGGNWGGDVNTVGFTSLGGFAGAEYYQMTDAKLLVDGATGTGNQVNYSSEAARQLVLDSLAYWTDWMQVDGFRFDLATVLGRLPDEAARRTGAGRGGSSGITRCCSRSATSPRNRTSRSSPRRGTCGDTRSATSQRGGVSGTAATAMPSAGSPRATATRPVSSTWSTATTTTSTIREVPRRPSISSTRTTASTWLTWSAIRRRTMATRSRSAHPTADPTTTCHGTRAVRRRCAANAPGTSGPSCSSPAACPWWWRATSSAGPRTATTTRGSSIRPRCATTTP